MFSYVKTKTISNFALKRVERGSRQHLYSLLEYKSFRILTQWNHETLIDCVNIWKRSEAAKTEILVQNEVFPCEYF